jgi:hypothetical protein
MHDAFAVRGIERIGDLDGIFEHMVASVMRCIGPASNAVLGEVGSTV